MVANDYVHRIGRTGRAGEQGDAISLVCVDETPMLRDIERLLGAPIPSEVVPGFEPDRSIRAEPIRLRTGSGRPQHGRGGSHDVRRGSGRSAHAGQSRRDGRRPRPGRPTAGASIGNRDGRWTPLPGERTRR
jgi:ATP-dependent RNA helicase RhlE